MNERRKKEILAATGIGLAAWGFLLFFENAYFAAGFYGVDVPSWAAWVGQIPIIWFNIVDTIAVALVILAVLLAATHYHSKRRRPSNARGLTAVGGVLLLLFLVLLAAAMYVVLGLTLPGLIQDLKGFLGW